MLMRRGFEGLIEISYCSSMVSRVFSESLMTVTTCHQFDAFSDFQHPIGRKFLDSLVLPVHRRKYSTWKSGVRRRAELSAKGAQCKSLGQRPRSDVRQDLLALKARNDGLTDESNYRSLISLLQSLIT